MTFVNQMLWVNDIILHTERARDELHRRLGEDDEGSFRGIIYRSLV